MAVLYWMVSHQDLAGSNRYCSSRTFGLSISLSQSSRDSQILHLDGYFDLIDILSGTAREESSFTLLLGMRMSRSG